MGKNRPVGVALGKNRSCDLVTLIKMRNIKWALKFKNQPVPPYKTFFTMGKLNILDFSLRLLHIWNDAQQWINRIMP
jgi:hypothetical protein